MPSQMNYMRQLKQNKTHLQAFRSFESLAFIEILCFAIVILSGCSDFEYEEMSGGVDKSGRAWMSSEFNQNHPMSDAFFGDTSALSESGVQAFLERSPYGRSWLANETISGQRISSVIYRVARDKGINPIVLLSRMQVEASLISAQSRPNQYSVDRAMGCGCPDGYACASEYLGLQNQIKCAAEKFRGLYDKSANGSGWWRKGLGKTTNDSYWVTPQSHATAALYAYTPWVLKGKGGTWLAWQVAQLFDTHVYNNQLDQIGQSGGGNDHSGNGSSSSNGSGSACGSFSDLASSHPGFGAVEAATKEGWISGCSADRFCPEDGLTRAQAASVIKNALNLGAAQSSRFNDTQGHWGQAAIEAVAAAGIMAGCAEGSFCPDETLTRAQAAMIISKATGISGWARSVYSDVPADHWAASAITGLYDRGYIGGCSATEFCLNSPARRWIFITWLADAKRLTKVSCR